MDASFGWGQRGQGEHHEGKRSKTARYRVIRANASLASWALCEMSMTTSESRPPTSAMSRWVRLRSIQSSGRL